MLLEVEQSNLDDETTLRVSRPAHLSLSCVEEARHAQVVDGLNPASFLSQPCVTFLDVHVDSLNQVSKHALVLGMNLGHQRENDLACLSHLLGELDDQTHHLSTVVIKVNELGVLEEVENRMQRLFHRLAIVLYIVLSLKNGSDHVPAPVDVEIGLLLKVLFDLHLLHYSLHQSIHHIHY